MKRALVVICLLSMLGSCRSEHYELIIRSDSNNENIKAGDPVCINGFKIGEVANVKLNNDFKVLYTLSIENKYSLPILSEFTITALNPIGDKQIKVVPSKQAALYKSGDTIKHISTYDAVPQTGITADSITDIIEAIDTLANRVVRHVKRK